MGQDRALSALEFGARIQAAGFNLYVLGNTGRQRHLITGEFLRKEAQGRPTPGDWVYVNNFDDPRKPRGLSLPAGIGARLRRDAARLIEELRSAVPAAFESETYRNRLAEIEQELNERNKRFMEGIENEARERGLGLMPTPHGFALAPVRDGKILSQEDFEALPEAERQRIENDIEELSNRLRQHFENLPAWHKEQRDRIRELDESVARQAIGTLIDAMRERYREHPAILDYLEAVREDLVSHAQELRAGGQPTPMPPGMQPDPAQIFARYQVNLMISHKDGSGAPVVYESNPTYQNLIGRVEHLSQFGSLVTDFTMIRPGALHLANGGYLILDADKVLLQPFAWDALKRAARNGEIRIESVAEFLSLIAAEGLEPDPAPLDVKIVLIGDRLLYYLLCEADPEFPQLFKVAVDFEDRIPRADENLPLYAEMLASIVHREQLAHFSSGAIARVIEESSRISGDSAKLSTDLQRITDLMSEADFLARQRQAARVEAEDVEAAVRQRNYRLDRLRETTHEAIQRNIVHVQTEGLAVGQVNGLSVLQIGEFAFGQPSRITATVRVGDGKLIDIEREAQLGGAIHSKGVMILGSFLGARYSRDLPLSFAASLVFEQSYGGVDGDSASVAELIALLSAIAELPVRQSLAITGSIDQHGKVQAIGGVNYKIEGFFDVCDARGLSGEQGVLIPADNVDHLMLRADVVEAISAGRFHVYPLTEFDEALALMTGLPAGRRGADGEFPVGSANRAIESALQRLAMRRQRFGKTEKRRARKNGDAGGPPA
ncbi:MAG: ATP-binding protein [Gammaproteobacteria bacterium]|nr:MAG: ATP-binding protein [Gammaproteobacteria bacterium]